MAYRYWSDLKSSELSTLAAETVALVPVGAIEQHGPHLPLSTDTALAEHMALAAAQCANHAKVLILPTMAFGKSDEHLSFKGTLTLDAATLTAVLLQIGRSIARAGVKRIVFLNAHGGNVPVLQIVSRTLRVELGLFCVTAGWMSMGYPEGLVPASELREGVHGGLVETAAMLHVRPDLVDMSQARHFVPASEAVATENTVLRMLGPVATGWVIEDLHPDGAAGNAAAATAAMGAAIIAHAATRYGLLLDEVARHPVDTLRGIA